MNEWARNKKWEKVQNNKIIMSDKSIKCYVPIIVYAERNTKSETWKIIISSLISLMAITSA
jgi:tyrosine-protein phosphatase YwqE